MNFMTQWNAIVTNGGIVQVIGDSHIELQCPQALSTCTFVTKQPMDLSDKSFTLWVKRGTSVIQLKVSPALVVNPDYPRILDVAIDQFWGIRTNMGGDNLTFPDPNPSLNAERKLTIRFWRVAGEPWYEILVDDISYRNEHLPWYIFKSSPSTFPEESSLYVFIEAAATGGYYNDIIRTGTSIAATSLMQVNSLVTVTATVDGVAANLPVKITWYDPITGTPTTQPKGNTPITFDVMANTYDLAVTYLGVDQVQRFIADWNSTYTFNFPFGNISSIVTVTATVDGVAANLPVKITYIDSATGLPKTQDEGNTPVTFEVEANNYDLAVTYQGRDQVQSFIADWNSTYSFSFPFMTVNHILAVNSNTIGVPFTLRIIGGTTMSYVTPFLGSLDEGAYEISMPTSITAGQAVYNFQRWNDGVTNPVKAINLLADTTLYATYTLVTPPNGTLMIDTVPIKGEIFVNGSSWGTAPQSRSLPSGISYNVSFGPISGYTTPSQIQANVVANMATEAVGIYVSILTAILSIHAFDLGVEIIATGTIIETGQTFTTPATVQVNPGDYNIQIMYNQVAYVKQARAESGKTTNVQIIIGEVEPGFNKMWLLPIGIGAVVGASMLGGNKKGKKKKK